MRKIRIQCLCAGLLVSFAISGVAAPDAALKECQALKDEIERYNQLRRQGGSGAEMDSWKRARRDTERRFRDLGCKYHRWQLK